MPTNIQLTLPNPREWINSRGLGTNGRVQKALTLEIYRMASPYTPMQTGSLQRNVEVGNDYLLYKSPYARFLWFGNVMVGKKSRSAYAKRGETKEILKPNKPLHFSGAPKRGPRWVERMWAEQRTSILKYIAKEIGGRAL